MLFLSKYIYRCTQEEVSHMVQVGLTEVSAPLSSDVVVPFFNRLMYIGEEQSGSPISLD
jgi:hypothetical protein